MTKTKLYNSEKWLRQKKSEGKTPEEIAILANTSRATIYRKLKDFNII